MLSGLVAAHEKGIVHRDIKPENVFLTSRVGCPPLVKLLDFGVSKMIAPLHRRRKDDDLDLTRTGMVMGTPYYMSPEQARGDRNLDARVDLYACGVILYEALTGRRPFTAPNYNALLLQILSTKPQPARDLRPALPNGFDAVLDKAMARNREDRYRSAAEFQRDLQTLRDRFNAAPAVDMAEAARARSNQPKSAPPPPPESAPQRPAVNPPPPLPRMKEPTPSSVEIPIVFSNDTPLSGEHMPVEATEMESRPRSHAVSPSDGSDFEEYPTQVQQSPFDRQRHDDGQTTTKRGPEFAQQLAQARGGVRDTDVMGKPPAHVVDPRAKPSPPRPQRKSSPDAREERDDQDTIIRSNASFPLPKRKSGAQGAGEPGRHHQGRSGGSGDRGPDAAHGVASAESAPALKAASPASGARAAANAAAPGKRSPGDLARATSSTG